MKETTRATRREYKKANAQMHRELRAAGLEAPAIERGSTKVYPLKNEADILAIQEYLLTHGRVGLRARNYLYFVLGISLGRRGGDIAKLRWCDLIDANGDFLEENVAFIREEKTRKRFSLACNAPAREAIKNYLSITGVTPVLNDYIFKSQIKGEDYVENDRMGRVIKAAAKAVGVKQNVCSHTLRKTYGYRLWKATGNLDLIRIMLNHKSAVETILYIGLDDDMKREAQELAAIPLVELSPEIIAGLGAVGGVACEAVSDVCEAAPATSAPSSVARSGAIARRGTIDRCSDSNTFRRSDSNTVKRHIIDRCSNVLQFPVANSFRSAFLTLNSPRVVGDSVPLVSYPSTL